MQKKHADKKQPCLEGFESVNRFWDPSAHKVMAKILPGEYYVTKNRELLATTLGSCIAACVRDKHSGVGGMNHFMLPLDSNEKGSIISNALRYGNWAMEHLINDVLKHGGTRTSLEIKLFGGAAVMASTINVGQKNIDFVREYLSTESFSIEAEDLGGTCPRKVIYDPKTGKAKLKKLTRINNDTIAKRESSYLADIKSAPDSGEVELF